MPKAQKDVPPEAQVQVISKQLLQKFPSNYIQHYILGKHVKSSTDFYITSTINNRIRGLTCKSFYAPQAFLIYIVKQMSDCVVLDSTVTLLHWTCFSLGKTPEETMSGVRCLSLEETVPTFVIIKPNPVMLSGFFARNFLLPMKQEMILQNCQHKEKQQSLTTVRP